MTDIQDTDIFFNLELQVREKLNELEWKTRALKEAQQEIIKVQEELLKKDMVLEENKRTIIDLKMQLSATNQVIMLMEKEKNEQINERIQLQINCNAAMKERECLLDQAHNAKLENMQLKLNLQKLSETVAINESSRASLEASLAEMKGRFSQVNNSFRSNVAILEKEHQLLYKSVESASTLNKRLQTVGLCTHAIYTKKNQEIHNLREQLAVNAYNNSLAPQIQNIPYHKKSRIDVKVLTEINICVFLNIFDNLSLSRRLRITYKYQ
ncbi:uncharacterized protein LOC131670451 [Phymastichus coffea]|uniref:uncharacterized protein LOC131670451 n=1 Tax=Phymastichus coffea TaxID=108790 RepID=UPI00273CACA9|nr:uncharacterized protein LOC131670451 [Phymastichus coffea]